MIDLTINSKNQQIKWWIWIYFWLLLFEGAARKWILPQASDFLLIVRDPIALWIYYLALKANKFPNNRLTVITFFIAFLMFLGGLINGILNDFPLIINLFGLRTNFLHLFLIYVIPNIFNYQDVKILGKWTIILSVPIAFLMVIQFVSPPDAYINKIVGLGEGKQIASALGKIRPPGIFAFITGSACFYALVLSFLLEGFLKKDIYPKWLLIISVLSTAIAFSVSGSRLTIISGSIVVASFFIIVIIKREFINKAVWFSFTGIVLAIVLSFTPIFLEGVSVLATRTENASEIESGSGGFSGRILSGFTGAFSDLHNLPLFGYGLGLGTNAGAALSGQRGKFLLAEGEWSRVILESGLLLGSIYLLIRSIIIFSIGRHALKNLQSGNTLPFLLSAACLPLLLNGQFGQPTILGFAVLGGGLTLAAGKTDLDGYKEDESITHQ